MRNSLLAACLLASLGGSIVFGSVIDAGIDTVSMSTAVFTITINDPYFAGGFTETISLTSGPFSIERQLQQGVGDGTASSYIDTEILGLTFHGTSTYAGAVTVRVGSDNGVSTATLGRIDNVLTTDPGSTNHVGSNAFVSGNSHFDVYFEVDIAGVTLYNKAPHTLDLPGITHLPPYGTHFPPVSDPPVGLYLEGTNTLLGNGWVFRDKISTPTTSKSRSLPGVKLQ